MPIKSCHLEVQFQLKTSQEEWVQPMPQRDHGPSPAVNATERKCLFRGGLEVPPPREPQEEEHTTLAHGHSRSIKLLLSVHDTKTLRRSVHGPSDSRPLPAPGTVPEGIFRQKEDAQKCQRVNAQGARLRQGRTGAGGQSPAFLTAETGELGDGASSSHSNPCLRVCLRAKLNPGLHDRLPPCKWPQ